MLQKLYSWSWITKRDRSCHSGSEHSGITTEMVYDGMIGTVPSTVGLVIQKGSKRTGAIITIIFLNVSTTC